MCSAPPSAGQIFYSANYLHEILLFQLKVWTYLACSTLGGPYILIVPIICMGFPGFNLQFGRTLCVPPSLGQISYSAKYLHGIPWFQLTAWICVFRPRWARYPTVPIICMRYPCFNLQFRRIRCAPPSVRQISFLCLLSA